MMKKRKPVSRAQAWLLVLVGLLMGTVFTVGEQYRNKPLSREEALSVTAVYDSSAERLRRGHVQEIIVRFADREQLYIDGGCVTEELRMQLRSLPAGTKVTLLVHPNSDTILDWRMEDKVLLQFQDTTTSLGQDRMVSAALGVGCYLMVPLGLYELLRRKKPRRKFAAEKAGGDRQHK